MTRTVTSAGTVGRSIIRAAASLALLLLPVAGAAGAGLPPVEYPPIAGRAADAAGFVPHGWRLEQEHRGDLDGDRREDLVLVLRMDDPANRIPGAAAAAPGFDTNPRMLVAAFALPEGGYRRVLSDHELVPRPHSPMLDDYLGADEGGGVEVADGALRVGLRMWANAGSWTTSQAGFTFRWRDGCFRLVGHDGFSLHRASGEIRSTSANYLTRRAWSSQGSINDEGQPPRQWVTLPGRPLPCLEEIGNGLDFDPGIPGPPG